MTIVLWAAFILIAGYDLHKGCTTGVPGVWGVAVLLAVVELALALTMGPGWGIVAGVLGGFAVSGLVMRDPKP